MKQYFDKFGKLIFDLPKSLPVFYKSVDLISHDAVDLMQGLFEHSCRYYSKVF